MAFKRLNDLRLIEEYCCKPVNVICPIYNTCYDNEFQCRYWKQVWKRHSDDFYIIRQGGHWYKDKISECEVENEYNTKDIRHINEKNQEYIAEGNRMTK